MSIKAVVFDNDGVLTDSEIVYGLTLTEILKDYGIDEDVKIISELTAGRSIEKALQIIEETFKVKLAEDTVDDWDKLADKYFSENLKACEGVLEMLPLLSIKKAVASTSAHYKIVNKHKCSGLDQFFSNDVLYSGEDVANHKPAPDVYLHAAKGIGIKPSLCLAVEDSISGIKAAKAAGMIVVGYVGASHIFNKKGHAASLKNEGADYVIEHMLDLPKIVESLS